MTFYKAKECFDDAKLYLDPTKDPVMWDLANGLSAMSEALQELESRISRLQAEVRDLKR